jgi:hypothetical protein
MAVSKLLNPKRSDATYEQEPCPFDDLHVRLLKRLTQSPTMTDAIADAATELCASAPGTGFFHAARTAEGELATPKWVLAPPDATIIADPALLPTCAETLASSRAIMANPSTGRRGAILAVGIYFRGRAPEVLGLCIPQEADASSLLAALQLAAASVSLWGALPRHTASPSGIADRCIAACQDAESLTAIYQRLSLILGDGFGVTVCVGQKRPSGGARLVASSAATRFSNSTALARAASEAFSATLASAEEQLWIFRDAINNEPGPVMSFALAAEAEFVFAVPLAEKDEAPEFALLLFGALPASQIERLVAELRAAKPRLAGFLKLLLRVRSQSNWERWLSPFARPFSGANRWISIPAATAIGLLLFLPVTDSAPATCTIEPSSRRYVVSPQDGLLAKSLIEAGQSVKAGQVLAMLDRHALELEIETQKAAIAQAQLKRDSAQARNEPGQAGIFTLEAQQAEESLELLELRFDQLSIRSPIEGVVLRGDLERTIGAPVTRGQVLFEVAPLDKMIAEIAIPEEEIHRVASGMQVTAKLDAFSGKTFTGQLKRIHPRAEMKEDASVFVAEMDLNAQGDPIRPGMKGHASIAASRSPLIWSWIRRPVMRLVRRLGW